MHCSSKQIVLTFETSGDAAVVLSEDFLFKAAVVYFYHLMKGVVHTDEPMENYHPALKLLSWSWGFLIFFFCFILKYLSASLPVLVFFSVFDSCLLPVRSSLGFFYPCLPHHPKSLLFFTFFNKMIKLHQLCLECLHLGPIPHDLVAQA